MISNFMMRNLSTQREVSFGQDVSRQYVYDDEGLDWGSVPATHNTYGYPEQMGVYISTTNVRERNVNVIGYAYYIATDTDKALYPQRADLEKYAYNKVVEKKKILNEIVNPTQYIRLTIGDYFIDGKPNSSVTYGATGATNNEYFCKFMISLYCNNPMFRKVVPLKTTISGTVPKFRFPLRMTPQKPVVFGVRRNYQLIAVENEGDSPVGCIITCTTRGNVTNPTFSNVITGESLTIVKDFVDAEKVVIDTSLGSRSVKGYYNGIEYNYFRYWDYENSWLQLPVGTSLIGYSVSEGDATFLDVAVEIIPLKYGLEEM